MVRGEEMEKEPEEMEEDEREWKWRRNRWRKRKRRRRMMRMRDVVITFTLANDLLYLRIGRVNEKSRAKMANTSQNL